MKDCFRILALVSICALASPAVAQEQPQKPTVIVKPVEMRAMARENEFIGRVDAVERVDIQARVTGMLEEPKFKDGDTVEAGQLLYVIEQAPYQADVDAKVAQVASAKAAAQNAAVNLQRAEELLRTRTGTRATVDQRQAELATADASVKIAEAALKAANITFGYTEIRAPIAGRIGKTAITQGNIVSPSSGALATIVKDDKVRANFAVSQREVLEYRKQHATKPPVVKLKLADNSDYALPGQIDYFDNVVDSRTDGLSLRATFDNPDHLLAHGQTVRVIIEQPAEAEQIVVPQTALAADQSGSFVLVVDMDNKVATRYLKIDRLQGDVAVVSDGIKPGENVIVQGAQRVRPGVEVNAQPAQAGN